MKFSLPKIGIGTGGDRREGFTLTELLVVLAVVALLSCILVSASAGGKDQSKVAQCAGNLKQFTLAMQIYGGENNDKLPTSNYSFWAWDLGWNSGTTITQWISFRQLYCPGTSVRFTDQDNLNLWNYGAPSTLHVVGYALTFPGNTSVIATNLNSTLTPQRISLSGSWLPAPSPAQRPLVADGTISLYGQYAYAQRYTYNYTSVNGGYAVPHLSPHLNGPFPAGGNVGMLDGHVEWRKFDSMQCRVNGSGAAGFWW